MFPPVLRRTAQSPRPVRHSTSSANPRQERLLLLLIQRVVPLIHKSVGQLVHWRTLRAEWKILYIHMTNHTYVWWMWWLREKEHGLKGWRLLLLLVSGRGRCRVTFPLTCPQTLKSNMYKHYSHICNTFFLFVCFPWRLITLHVPHLCHPFYSPTASQCCCYLMIVWISAFHFCFFQCTSWALWCRVWFRFPYRPPATVPEKGRQGDRNSVAASC